MDGTQFAQNETFHEVTAIMRKFWRSATECLVASLALVSLTVICYRLHVNIATAALLFVIVVVTISRVGSFVSSVFAGPTLPTVYLIPIPFLIWAAIRFGPVGACLSITIFVCISCWCAYIGQGPFLRSISIDHVTILQMCWIMISAPLYCLAAVVCERRIALEDLKSAYSQMQQFTPRLLSAQEQEKQRISRELHDDVGQRLAMATIELTMLDEKIPAERAAEHTELRGVLTQLHELTTDVHNMSHQLHSSKLRLLGLRPALKEVCQQIACKHHVAINLTAGQLPDSLPEQICLCFYRVAQEALMNAVKHSGASRVDVCLDCSGEVLRMSVRDYGIGFDPLGPSKGLGLVTMQERLRMVGGVLRFNSIADEGTVLEAEASIGDDGKSKSSSKF